MAIYLHAWRLANQANRKDLTLPLTVTKLDGAEVFRFTAKPETHEVGMTGRILLVVLPAHCSYVC